MEFLVLIIALIIYSSRIVFFLIGSKKERNLSRQNHDNFIPFVSIIIPSRNEEKNIEKCVRSISNSNYPKENFEILVVNDRSTDNTQIVAENLINEISNLRVVNVTEANRNKNLKGKPGALDFGINNAKGEIILMTDADCIVSEDWIRSIVNTYFDPNVKIGAAFTTTSQNTVFEKFQSIEWITMCTMGSSGVALNYPIGCFGNNMSIRKDTYFEIGGYENIKFSITEDLALLKSVMDKGYGARFLCSAETLVKTKPVASFNEYLKQHHRWAKGGMDLGWFAVYFVTVSLSIWISTLILILMASPLFFIPILFKAVTDFIQIYFPLNTLKQQKMFFWVIFGTFFFLFIELVAPILLLKKNIVWKDQIFR